MIYMAVAASSDDLQYACSAKVTKPGPARGRTPFTRDGDRQT
jgi:hypothetical protein